MATGEAVQTLPDGFVPIQATYGDETQTTDVTPSVMAKVKGTAVDVTADKSLIPALSFSDSVDLTDDEKADIQKQVSSECGGRPNDNKCVETLTDRYTQAKLQEKASLQTQAGAVKGDRMTVIAVNANGQQRTFYVPKGTRLLGGDAASNYLAQKAMGKKASAWWETVRPAATDALQFGALAFMYVVSILTTWRTLTEEGYGAIRWVAIAIAVLIPYSGFFIQLGIFAAARYGAEIMSGLQKKSQLGPTVAKP